MPSITGRLRLLVLVAGAASLASSNIAGAETFLQVVAGYNHTCALTTSGGVKCWGDNSDGELGDGTHTSSATPVEVSGLAGGAIAIAAGYSHTCALTSEFGVKCWGRNSEGELGDGTNVDRTEPVDVLGFGFANPVVAISAGFVHTCAVINTLGGGAKCWGSNDSGQLGDGTTLTRLTPVDVVGLAEPPVGIAAGARHTCAVIGAGTTVQCWGNNDNGALGNGTTSTSYTPVNVVGLAGQVSSIAAGSDYTCAVAGGAAACWGFNSSGQLGDGTRETRLAPVAVSGLMSGVLRIVASNPTCALTEPGAVLCWGYNGVGGVGDGTQTDRLAPVPVAGIESDAFGLAVSGSHSCAVTATGGVKCWGLNASGQLGDGTTLMRLTPVDVAGTPVPVDVIEYYAASLDHYFITWHLDEIAALDTGVIKGWGRTGYSFKAYPVYALGTWPVCRFYIPPAYGDSHFFARGFDECIATQRRFPQFILEDPAFMQMYVPVDGLCPPETVEVYRVFDNRTDANHRYMTDPALRAQMVAKGWVAEGDGPDLVVMCGPR